MAAETRHRLATSDGFELAAWSAVPREDPRGIVVLCHGLATGADDDGPFLPLRDLLVRRGFAVVRFDARCHGETGGDWSRLSLRGWRDDVEAAIGLARQLGGGPLLLLAASFAAGPAIEAIFRRARDCAGLVLWNPILDYRRANLSDEFRLGAEILASEGDPTLPHWAVYRVPWSEVPLTPELVAEMKADRTPSLAAELPCDGLVIHGCADPIVAFAISRAIVAEAPRLRLRAIPIARHGFRGFRPLVRALTAAWLRRAAHMSV